MSRKLISRRTFLSYSTMAAATMFLDWDTVLASSAKIERKTKFPVVVIGAGLGGLCCGAYLAKHGFPVTMIEQHAIPGGYATSFERADGRFNFDVSLHRTSFSPEKRQMMKDLGILDQLDIVKIPNTARIILPGDDMQLSLDAEGYFHRLSERYPHEADGVRRYVSHMFAVADELALLRRQGGSADFSLKYPNLWRIRNQTLGEFIDAHVKDPELKQLLSFGWGGYGLPPSKLSAFLYIVATTGAMKNGRYYIRSRSQDLSNAMAESIETNGGTVIYDTAVEKIKVKGNAVSGVIAADGKHYAAKTVVSNASALTTFNRMLPPGTLPDEYMRRISDYQPSISTFVVWLGLNRDLTGVIEDARLVIASGRGAEADFQSCLKGEIEKMSFGVTIYDNYYKGYSTPGTSTLAIVTLSGYTPWRKYEADYNAGRKQAYEKEKARWANLLIRKLERQAIAGLSSMIEVMEAATPLTNQYYTGNTQGAVYGFEQSVDNAFMNRIKNGTPVKGLYLAGAWGRPGGGYGAAMRSGQVTFQHIVQAHQQAGA